MSENTEPKKSFLTRLMENARNETTPIDEEKENQNAKANYAAGIVFGASLAVGAVVLTRKFLSKMAPVEDETSETATED